jgi:hypothetical protein
MNSWSSPLGGSVKTATRFEIPLCTRSAASSAPAPPESSDKTTKSAEAMGSFTTSAHPAVRRTGSRREGIETIANAAKVSTAKIGAHLVRLKIILFCRIGECCENRFAWAHVEDIGLRCGGTVLCLAPEGLQFHCLWIVFSGTELRETDAQSSIPAFLENISEKQIEALRPRDGHRAARRML